MENKYHNVDEIFRHSLGNYSADPPAHVWDNIDSALDKMDGKRKSRFMWFMGSFLAVATAFVGGYYLSGYLAGDTREVARPENSFIKVRTVLLADAFIRMEKVKHSFNEKVTLRNAGSSHTVNTNDNTHAPIDRDTRTASQHNRNINGGNNTTTAGSHSVTGNQSTNPTMQIHPQNNDAVRNVSTNPTENLGQINNTRVDKGYFSSGSANINQNNNTKPVTNEVPDSLKKNDTDEGNGNKPQSYNADPKSLNDAQKIALANELKKKQPVDGNQLAAQNNNTNTSVTPVVSKEDGVNKEEDLSYLLPSYPIITVLPYFAPMYTLQNANNENDDQYSPVFGGSENFNEKATFSWSSGVMLGYNFTKRLTVFIGCAYNQFSSVSSRNDLQVASALGGDTTGEVYSSAGMINGMNMVYPSNEGIEPYLSPVIPGGAITQMRQTFGFVEVPVLVRYKFFGERVGMTLTGGLSTGFLVRNEVFAENNTDRVSTGSTANMRNFNLNAQLGVGLEVKILPWMFFNFEPTVRYSFLNWSTDPKIKMNPVFFSANTGLAFKF